MFAKLSNGDMAASIPVICQLVTTPPQKALRYGRRNNMRKFISVHGLLGLRVLVLDSCREKNSSCDL